MNQQLSYRYVALKRTNEATYSNVSLPKPDPLVLDMGR